MKRLPTLALSPAVAALVAALAFAPAATLTMPARAAECSASSAHAFTRGHQDFALRGSGASMSLVANDAVTDRDYSQGEFYVELPDSAAFTNDSYTSVPHTGWLIPQTQDESVPWVGFNTSYIDAAEAAGATLTMELHDGPAGGRVVGFQDNVGAEPDIRFDSDNPNLVWDYPDHFHSHTAIAFTERGAYAVTFTFTLRDGSTHSLDVPFLVGGTDASQLCSLRWDGSGSGGTDAGADNKPKQLAKDINDTAKEIAALDKAVDGTLKEAGKYIGVTPTSSARTSAAPHAKGAAASTTASKARSQKQRSSQEPQPQRQGAPAPAGAPRQAAQAAASRPHAAASDKAKASSAAKAPRRRDGQTQAAGTSSGNGAENPVQAVSYEQPLLGFWAGVLAGMGALGFLLGGGLFLWVQFFRGRGR